MNAAVSDDLLTYFPETPVADEMPSIMPSPFSNAPHPLAEKACLMLQERLATQTDLPRDFFSTNGGKMFGVLVVRDQGGGVGFLSGFSAMMNGEWIMPGFVPQVYDQAGHDAFLSDGNEQLADLTAQLQQLERSSLRASLKQQIAALMLARDQQLSALKQKHKAAKDARKQQRQILQQRQDLSDAERQPTIAALALASQHHKREATNAMMIWSEQLQVLQDQLVGIEAEITSIKETRTEKSRILHRRVFETYVLTNHLNEKRPMTDFFEGMPPAGAGDCAGPKLIQYAHQHGLYPLALAEFWWGTSPASGIRHHGQFYPACRGKCHPILPFMLRGLEVEAEPDFGLAVATVGADEPQVVFEDDDLLVLNKPAGLMSSPGKYVKDSVYTRLMERYPELPELKLVHRLDMATSGLLLVAKNLRVNKQLQKQFIQRSVEKRYEALLNRRLPPDMQEGDIDLPLRVDFDDRPRQVVCYEYGKAAQTHWQVIGYEGETTRILFYPHTGRTHQLRMHASHKDGLNAAIIGDALYGEDAERLMLHAQRLCFNHPKTRERMEFEIPAPF
ncbi:MAG: pseudouridine synthase [Mariprofundus sp.]|nr:pseudouridine synthase [Mariprofundus sp.]